MPLDTHLDEIRRTSLEQASKVSREIAREEYRAAYQGESLASLRALQAMRCKLDERQQWVMDCRVGSGLSAAEMCNGDKAASANIERCLSEALDILGGDR